MPYFHRDWATCIGCLPQVLGVDQSLPNHGMGSPGETFCSFFFLGSSMIPSLPPHPPTHPNHHSLTPPLPSPPTTTTISYCPSNPDGSPAYMRLCRKLIEWGWEAADRNLQHLGASVAGFLTEFGAVGNDEDSLELLRVRLRTP